MKLNLLFLLYCCRELWPVIFCPDWNCFCQISDKTLNFGEKLDRQIFWNIHWRCIIGIGNVMLNDLINYMFSFAQVGPCLVKISGGIFNLLMYSSYRRFLRIQVRQDCHLHRTILNVTYVMMLTSKLLSGSVWIV